MNLTRLLLAVKRKQVRPEWGNGFRPFGHVGVLVWWREWEEPILVWRGEVMGNNEEAMRSARAELNRLESLLCVPKC